MDTDELAALLNTLGNRHSLAILAELADGEQYVSELADKIGISRPLLYLHLKKLENVGLVNGEIRHFDEPPYTKKYFHAKDFHIKVTLQRIKEIVKSD
ncbi:MAG TPA: ArsR family transcriptional regulator [Methanosarcinaceae archaeon]|nr:ArsR family transcriptional regulator [Methanosarcinaceae archaeon]